MERNIGLQIFKILNINLIAKRRIIASTKRSEESKAFKAKLFVVILVNQSILI